MHTHINHLITDYRAALTNQNVVPVILPIVYWIVSYSLSALYAAIMVFKGPSQQRPLSTYIRCGINGDSEMHADNNQQKWENQEIG